MSDWSVTRPGLPDRVRSPPVGTHRGYGRSVFRRLTALVIAGVLSVFAVLLLTGRYVNQGPVLLRLGEDHGIHAGDLLVVLGWAAAVLSEVGLVMTTRRR